MQLGCAPRTGSVHWGVPRAPQPLPQSWPRSVERVHEGTEGGGRGVHFIMTIMATPQDLAHILSPPDPGNQIFPFGAPRRGPADSPQTLVFADLCCCHSICRPFLSKVKCERLRVELTLSIPESTAANPTRSSQEGLNKPRQMANSEAKCLQLFWGESTGSESKVTWAEDHCKSIHTFSQAHHYPRKERTTAK